MGVPMTSTTSTSATSSSGSGIRLYTQTITNTPDGTIGSSKNIGTLTKDKTALALSGELTNSGDQYDYYNFNVTDSGATTLTIKKGSGNVDVKVLSASGQVLADNKGNASQQANFQALEDGKYNLNKGKYYLKVSRGSGVSTSKAMAYGILLGQGSYTKDYQTTAKEGKSSASSGTSDGSLISTDLFA